MNGPVVGVRRDPAACASLLLALTVLLCRPCRGDDFAAPDSTWVSPWEFHAGLLGRVAGSTVPPGEDLGALFSTGLAYQRRRPGGDGWGAGLRLLAESDRGRWALGGLWRRGLGAGGRGYWQLSPGLTLAAVGESPHHLHSRFPGFYLEAELGHARWGAVTALLQVQPGSYPARDAAGRLTSTWLDDTDTSVYVGGKVFGWRGFFLVLILGALVVSEANGLN